MKLFSLFSLCSGYKLIQTVQNGESHFEMMDRETEFAHAIDFAGHHVSPIYGGGGDHSFSDQNDYKRNGKPTHLNASPLTLLLTDTAA